MNRTSLDDTADWHLTQGVTVTAQIAAKWLLAGRTVDYQPGDGGRYECQLIQSGINSRHYLAVLNLNMVVWVRPGMRVDLWVRDPNGGLDHPGLWMALRPLFAALGYAPGQYAQGGLGINSRDSQDEADERAAQHTNQPYDRRDADLGRAVRLMVQARDDIPTGEQS